MYNAGTRTYQADLEISIKAFCLFMPIFFAKSAYLSFMYSAVMQICCRMNNTTLVMMVSLDQNIGFFDGKDGGGGSKNVMTTVTLALEIFSIYS